MFYKLIRNIARVLLAPFYPVRIHGSENIPDTGKLILCSNHASNWDPIFISIGVTRKINWMGKKELFQNKVLSFLIRKLGVFPVDRDGSDINAIKNSLRILKKDEILGIFPEGTRVKEFKPENVKHGATLLSVRSKSPILPVYIDSNYKIFNKVNIYIGKPIEYYKETDKNIKEKDYGEISRELLETIYSLK